MNTEKSLWKYKKQTYRYNGTPLPQALHDVGLAAFFIFTGPLPGESFKRLRKMGCGFKPAQARYLFNGQAGCVQKTLRSVGASVHDILMDAYSLSLIHI